MRKCKRALLDDCERTLAVVDDTYPARLLSLLATLIVTALAVTFLDGSMRFL
ncbi:hypothetical protein OIE66_31100 [Nonomuraea sp. NBC_01738]|uniref:hypothetical protein n=1 Tax=Nonomuraea sp. NBC_01738 TaxID=2976003 RepID=UPI002E11E1A2|nr:hypothetical protein OIE66_31100 [Nonomuraea sp. NBC_01738]